MKALSELILQGRTALMMASYRGRVDIVRVLLASPANPSMRDKQVRHQKLCTMPVSTNLLEAIAAC